jgi:hypothetical protein
MRFLLLSVFLATPAHALDLRSSVELYYFTTNQEKTSAVQTERAEENQVFHAPSDPREVARELAQAELLKGNVCLAQADRDLRLAHRNKQLSRMCKEIFSDEIAGAEVSARRKRWSPQSVECEAGLEVRETPVAMELVLAFRSRVLMGKHVPEKLAGAGFADEPRDWALPVYEATLGDSSSGWKGILKSHSCTLDKKALDAFLGRFLAEAKEARAFRVCKQRHGVQVERIQRVQSQLKQYVPEDWLAQAGGKKLDELLRARAGSEALASLQACRSARAEAGEQLEGLLELSERVARKHKIPVLDPKNQPAGRELASSDLEEEE